MATVASDPPPDVSTGSAPLRTVSPLLNSNGEGISVLRFAQTAAQRTTAGVGNVAQGVGAAVTNIGNIRYLGFERGGDDQEAAESAKKAMQEAFVLKEEEFCVDGNLYRYFAFRRFGIQKVNGVSLFEEPTGWFNRVIHKWGLIMVIIIQILGPLSIFVSSLATLNFDLGAWKNYTLAQWCTVILSWCFLFCFILNAYYNVDSDEKTLVQCDRIARSLLYIGEPVDPVWLWADSIVNCWVAVICSFCMYSLLLSEETPKDVMLDALGLAFLLRIDDISGEMGFLGGVWDPRKVGRLYEQLRDAKIFEKIGCAEEDEEDSSSDQDARSILREDEDEESASEQDQDAEAGNDNGQPAHRHQRQGTMRFTATSSGPLSAARNATVALGRGVQKAPRQVPQLLFKLSKVLLVVLLVLAVPSPFLFASNAEDDASFDKVFGRHHNDVPGKPQVKKEI